MNTPGIPSDEIVQFIIKADSLNDAHFFVMTDDYYINTIKKIYPEVDLKNINAIITRFTDSINEYIADNSSIDSSSMVLDDEHIHMTTKIEG